MLSVYWFTKFSLFDPSSGVWGKHYFIQIYIPRSLPQLSNQRKCFWQLVLIMLRSQRNNNTKQLYFLHPPVNYVLYVDTSGCIITYISVRHKSLKTCLLCWSHLNHVIFLKMCLEANKHLSSFLHQLSFCFWQVSFCTAFRPKMWFQPTCSDQHFLQRVCGGQTRSSWSVSRPHQRQAASLIMGLA